MEKGQNNMRSCVMHGSSFLFLSLTSAGLRRTFQDLKAPIGLKVYKSFPNSVLKLFLTVSVKSSIFTFLSSER